MKNIIFLSENFSVFWGETFYIFESACFCKLVLLEQYSEQFKFPKIQGKYGILVSLLGYILWFIFNTVHYENTSIQI